MNNFEKAKYYFSKNLWTTKMLQNLVIKGKLSQDEYNLIVEKESEVTENEGIKGQNKKSGCDYSVNINYYGVDYIFCTEYYGANTDHYNGNSINHKCTCGA